MGHIRREFTKILYQKRTLFGWTGLFVLPFIIAIALRFSPGPGGHGPSDQGALEVFMAVLKTNGTMLPLVIMAMLATFLLPLLACMAGAQTVAGEAEKGTLRTNLMQPVKRTGLLAGKWFIANVYMLLGFVVLAVATLVAAASIFGLHSTMLLSGQTVSVGDALLRTLAAYAYVFVGMVPVVSVALLLSTLTDSSLTAVAGALVLVIVMLVLGNLSVFDFLRPYLITSHLDAWSSLFSKPMVWGPVWKGLVTFAAWTVGAAGLATWRFQTKDITS
jgi:ABC-2 type transport system permease protein